SSRWQRFVANLLDVGSGDDLEGCEFPIDRRTCASCGNATGETTRSPRRVPLNLIRDPREEVGHRHVVQHLEGERGSERRLVPELLVARNPRATVAAEEIGDVRLREAKASPVTSEVVGKFLGHGAIRDGSGLDRML